jgi:hypothetical protein
LARENSSFHNLQVKILSQSDTKQIGIPWSL